MNNWTMRRVAGEKDPETLAECWTRARHSTYADSGIQRHLDYLSSLARGKDIVELGTGGGDQSTMAWIAGGARSLTTYDCNPPPSLPLLEKIAAEAGCKFRFVHGSTNIAPTVESCDILFVDTSHTAEIVEIELKRFAPLCGERIIAHDIESYGRAGITLAFGEFLFKHPREWVVERYSADDNGLLTLRRMAVKA